uniref:Copia protein n=1 Tax=Cajanus cajan TaxID=3821 RepID=A0A151RR64_CAJCA|nr:Copia protein [Cajanus cajan]
MSRSGKNYFMTFIDDFYRYTKVYLIRHKDEAFDMFSSYKAEVENQLNKMIKSIRSDRGGEYTLFNDYCEKEGIIHEVTPPYSEHLSFLKSGTSSTQPSPLETSSESMFEDSRRSKRQRQETSFGNDFYTYLVEDDPISFSEAISSSDAKFWKEAIRIEIDSIKENNTWTLVDLPKGAKLIDCKWIFKRKYNLVGYIEKYKARLVAKGFTQK